VAPWVFALAVVLVFMVGYLGARSAGLWRNGISDQEYIQRVQQIHDPGYGHPGR
jgi:ABC-type transporter Mla maintaining outer membrane lipid asymmetry permease subunit MlaE